MPILNFPNNPSVGDTYTGDNGISYIWDGNKWGGHTAAIDTINTNSSYLINNGNVIQVDGTGNLVIPVGAGIFDADGNPISTGGGGATVNRERIESGAVEGGWARGWSPATGGHPATSGQQVPPGGTSVPVVHSTNVL